LLTTPVPEAFWEPDMVIYHDKCADGIVAAWACWKRWGDAPEYRAANYGHQVPDDVAGKKILIVDFSWPADELRAMVAAGAASIVILDHHKTAQEALEPFDPRVSMPWLLPALLKATDIHNVLRALEGEKAAPIVAIFDMTRSGARMAWDFVQPFCSPPRLVELAERYDLWRFVPGTEDTAEALHLDIQAGAMTIADMEELDRELHEGDEPLVRGRVIYGWRRQLVEEIASRAHLRTVAGVPGVISVECPYSLVSSVGHYLLDKYPAAPFAAMSVTGEKAVTWSLRSHDDRTDVSVIAKSMGGGGHRNAAGFRVDTTPTRDFLAKLRRINFERWSECPERPRQTRSTWPTSLLANRVRSAMKSRNSCARSAAGRAVVDHREAGRRDRRRDHLPRQPCAGIRPRHCRGHRD
jgi:oligoribonuclease NrnB/cAMP/cGMP phosphodiesterase (DHH superfamily)